MSAIRQYLEKREYSTVKADFYAKIKNWKDWYQCTIDDLHKSSFYNGLSIVDKNIKMLGMAKTICEIWANLLMNEKVILSVGDEEQDKKLQAILEANNFRLNANQLCELYFALGTGAFVEYKSEEKPRIDFISADLIFPLSWDNRGVRECAFASKVHINGKDCYYLQMHILNENKKYKIENHLFVDDDQAGYKEIELPEEIEEVFETRSDIPLFQILKPNIINNYDLGNPMGISVYANAEDVLMEIDNAFDALDVEIETGRRMVFVSKELIYTDIDGNPRNVISEREKVLRYIGNGGSDGRNEMIKDYSPAFRTNDIKETIQFQLNLLSEKTGMGTNMFEFQASGAKTATEIISEDSDLYQNLKKHEIVLEAALKQMIYALQILAAGTEQAFEIKEINIQFDDSIIEDKAAEREKYRADLAAGVMGPVEYRMKVYGEDEETAKKMIPEQANVME